MSTDSAVAITVPVPALGVNTIIEVLWDLGLCFGVRVDPPRRGSPCGCRGSPSGPRGPRDYLRFRWLFADTFPDMSSWGCCSAVVLCSLCPYFTLGPFIFLQLFLLEFLTQGVMITLDLHRQFPPAEVVAQHCSVSTFQSALLTLHCDSWFSFEF